MGFSRTLRAPALAVSSLVAVAILIAGLGPAQAYAVPTTADLDRAVRVQADGQELRWAAAGPDAYDCSGLMMASWHAAGRTLPHSAALQWSDVQHIQRSQLRPGDLVFYYRDIHHVARYAGDGRVIEAPQAGEQVSIHPIDFAPIYGYGRVS